MIQSTQSSLAIPELRVCKPVALLSPMFHEVATEELSEKPLACLLRHSDPPGCVLRAEEPAWSTTKRHNSGTASSPQPCPVMMLQQQPPKQREGWRKLRDLGFPLDPAEAQLSSSPELV